MPPRKKRTKRVRDSERNAENELELIPTPARDWFNDMPLEILLEVTSFMFCLRQHLTSIHMQIFWYLAPLELLYLARTTKALRAFLLNRQKSLRYWRCAFESIVNLPPCPSFLSEPEYANLAFVPFCHACHFFVTNSCRTLTSSQGCSARCDSPLWELRLRSCEACLPCGKTVYACLTCC